MLHPFNVPTEMESIMHFEELGRQYKWWLQGWPKRLDGVTANEEKFNFIKGDSSNAKSKDSNVGIEIGLEDSDEDWN